MRTQHRVGVRSASEKPTRFGTPLSGVPADPADEVKVIREMINPSPSSFQPERGIWRRAPRAAAYGVVVPSPTPVLPGAQGPTRQERSDRWTGWTELCPKPPQG